MCDDLQKCSLQINNQGHYNSWMMGGGGGGGGGRDKKWSNK